MQCTMDFQLQLQSKPALTKTVLHLVLASTGHTQTSTTESVNLNEYIIVNIVIKCTIMFAAEHTDEKTLQTLYSVKELENPKQASYCISRDVAEKAGTPVEEQHNGFNKGNKQTSPEREMAPPSEAYLHQGIVKHSGTSVEEHLPNLDLGTSLEDLIFDIQQPVEIALNMGPQMTQWRACDLLPSMSSSSSPAISSSQSITSPESMLNSVPHPQQNIQNDLEMLDDLIANPPPLSEKDLEDINNIVNTRIGSRDHHTEYTNGSQIASPAVEQRYPSTPQIYPNYASEQNTSVQHERLVPRTASTAEYGQGNVPYLCSTYIVNGNAPQPIHCCNSKSRSKRKTAVRQTAVNAMQGSTPRNEKIYRKILPGPPLPRLTSQSATERLLQRMDPQKKIEKCAFISVLPESELLRGDEDGNNHLMILVSKLHTNLLELVYALVERMKDIPGALEAMNNEGESALFVASISLPQEPLVARYIAETLLAMNVNIAELAYEGGQSIAHCVSERGDSHQNVLAELLSLKDREGKPVFNLNKPNDCSGHTPLHVAACSHGKDNVCSIGTLKLLVKEGANLLEQDWKAGFTVLHIAVREACDPPLVLAILEEAHNTDGGTVRATNIVTYNGDTPLHLVAVNDNVCVKKQCEAFRLLVYHGAERGKRNRGGKVALALVAKARRENWDKAQEGHDPGTVAPWFTTISRHANNTMPCLQRKTYIMEGDPQSIAS